MESMVTTAPSAWMQVQSGLRTFSLALRFLQVIVVLWIVISFVNLVLFFVLDLGWVMGVLLVWALVGLRDLCRGLVERTRQLSSLVGSGTS